MSAEVSLANTNTANIGATRANTTIYGYAPKGTWGTDPLFIKPAGESSQVVYPITDHLGTPQMLVNQAGATVWEGQYSAFWIPLNQASDDNYTNSTQTLRFPGQYADSETQLYYNWNRYYDPETGRYITSDPIGLADGVQTYSYSWLNPVLKFDSSGKYAVVLRPARKPEGVCEQGHCRPTDSTATKSVKANALRACVFWRSFVATVCFADGNKKHKKKLAEARKALKYCEKCLKDE